MVSWVCEIIPTVYADKTHSLLLIWLFVHVDSVLIWVCDAALDGGFFPNTHKQGYTLAMTTYTQQHLYCISTYNTYK